MKPIEQAIEEDYFPHLVDSFARWSAGVLWPVMSADVSARVAEFEDGLTFKKGRNYIKIISERNGGNRSVHSFIVIKATKGFEVGDILKAAGWNAPATNFKRGNVFCPDNKFLGVTWTGAGG